MEIKINNTIISEMKKPYFIADIAANHDGSLDRAKRLIRLAAESGADAAKFQHFRADHIVSDYGFRELGKKYAHQASWTKSIYQVYKEASLPWEWTSKLKEAADDYGIDFFTATYDLEAIEHVNDYVCAFKVGSGDINWHESIKKMIEKNKPILVATGASTIEEVKQVHLLLSQSNANFVLMQCNTNYSGDVENIKHSNLKSLLHFKELFPETILGLSDHTPGDHTVLGAIALGARVIEKHFTDDTNRVGPDHKFSMSPEMWDKMVQNANLVFAALGDGRKKVELNEEESRIVQRRAIRFTRDLKKGHVLERSDISVLRPAPPQALGPNSINEIIGKSLKESVKQNQLVQLSSLSFLND